MIVCWRFTTCRTKLQTIELAGHSRAWIDLLSNSRITMNTLEPYQYLWLRPVD